MTVDEALAFARSIRARIARPDEREALRVLADEVEALRQVAANHKRIADDCDLWRSQAEAWRQRALAAEDA